MKFKFFTICCIPLISIASTPINAAEQKSVNCEELTQYIQWQVSKFDHRVEQKNNRLMIVDRKALLGEIHEESCAKSYVSRLSYIKGNSRTMQQYMQALRKCCHSPASAPSPAALLIADLKEKVALAHKCQAEEQKATAAENQRDARNAVLKRYIEDSSKN
jgi:hypothetical protein